MAQPRISAYLPPDIDPTKAALAFGRRALPKLNEELQSPELLTQQRALMALCDLVHDPEKVYQAVALGKWSVLTSSDTVGRLRGEPHFTFFHYFFLTISLMMQAAQEKIPVCSTLER